MKFWHCMGPSPRRPYLLHVLCVPLSATANAVCVYCLQSNQLPSSRTPFTLDQATHVDLEVNSHRNTHNRCIQIHATISHDMIKIHPILYILPPVIL